MDQYIYIYILNGSGQLVYTIFEGTHSNKVFAEGWDHHGAPGVYPKQIGVASTDFALIILYVDLERTI